MMSRLSIKMRLTIFACVFAVGIFITGVASLYMLRSQMLDDRLAQMRFIMDSTLSIGRAAMKNAGGPTEAGKRAFIETIRALRYGPPEDKNYAFGYYYSGINFSHINPARQGVNMLESKDQVLVDTVRQVIDVAKLPQGNTFLFYNTEHGNNGPKVPKVSLIQNIPELEGLIGIGLYLDDIDAVFWARAETGGALFVVLIGICAAFAFAVRRSIIKPLGELTANMSRLADGNTDIVISGIEARTEIGALARAMAIFRNNSIERQESLQREQAEDERRLARTRKIETLNQGFDSEVGRLLDKVERAVTDFQSASRQLSATAEETNARVTAVAEASEQSSGSVRSAAVATEELTASVSVIGEQVRNSSAIANRAVAEARATNAQIAGLAQATGRIGEVVSLITSIASQTNLLALNATIEAARAGDAGRGFAVVASEVKNLATQTAKATDEIAGQISSIQQETQQAVDAIQAIAATIESINEIAASVANSVEEQKLATEEIAGNASIAAAGTNDVTQNIGKVADAARQTEATSRSLSEAASDLQMEARTLRQAVQTFLSEVKAA